MGGGWVGEVRVVICGVGVGLNWAKRVREKWVGVRTAVGYS